MENFIIVLVIATSPLWIAFGLIGLVEVLGTAYDKIKG